MSLDDGFRYRIQVSLRAAARRGGWKRSLVLVNGETKMSIHIYDRNTHTLHVRGGQSVSVPGYVTDCRVGMDLAENVATWARANNVIRRGDLVGA